MSTAARVPLAGPRSTGGPWTVFPRAPSARGPLGPLGPPSRGRRCWVACVRVASGGQSAWVMHCASETRSGCTKLAVWGTQSSTHSGSVFFVRSMLALIQKATAAKPADATELHLDGKTVSNFDGLEQCTALSHLSMTCCNIKSLNGFPRLPALRRVRTHSHGVEASRALHARWVRS